jgi:uncharacterized protein YegL
MTDGLPTDEHGKESASWQRIVPMLEAGAAGKNFQLWAIGVGHLSAKGQQVLSTLAPNGFSILGGFPFQSLLQQLSASIGEMMRSPSQETVNLAQIADATLASPTDEQFGWMFGQHPAGE